MKKSKELNLTLVITKLMNNQDENTLRTKLISRYIYYFEVLVKVNQMSQKDLREKINDNLKKNLSQSQVSNELKKLNDNDLINKRKKRNENIISLTSNGQFLSDKFLSIPSKETQGDEQFKLLEKYIMKVEKNKKFNDQIFLTQINLFFKKNIKINKQSTILNSFLLDEIKKMGSSKKNYLEFFIIIKNLYKRDYHNTELMKNLYYVLLKIFKKEKNYNVELINKIILEIIFHNIQNNRDIDYSYSILHRIIDFDLSNFYFEDKVIIFANDINFDPLKKYKIFSKLSDIQQVNMQDYIISKYSKSEERYKNIYISNILKKMEKEKTECYN